MPRLKDHPPASRKSQRLITNQTEQTDRPIDDPTRSESETDSRPGTKSSVEDEIEVASSSRSPELNVNAQENNPRMMGDANDPASEIARLEAEILRLRNALRNDTPSPRPYRELRHREPSVESAFGGTSFKAKGMAAWPAFTEFQGTGGINPVYNDKAKARADSPPKFAGDKTQFDSWLIKVADKFEEDVAIFRTEKSRMRYLMNLLEDKAEKAMITRYVSVTRPFSSAAEMIQILESMYHDPNQSIAAREALKKHEFELGKGQDIHEFIATFNSLAQQAKVREEDWKQTLWGCIPADLDHRLLHDSENIDIDYETFCQYVTKAVYSNQLAQERRKDRESTDKTSTKNETRSRQKTASTKVRSRYKPKNYQGDRTEPITMAKAGRSLTYEEKKAHWDANTCFMCGRGGHNSKDCPEKERIRDVKAVKPKQQTSSLDSETTDESGKDPAIAKQAAERLGARLQRLKTPLLLSDYRKQDAGRITHKLKATLEIDGRRFSNQMFYVTESGHDMFIGQDWLVEQDVWIHPKTQTFAWPERTPSLAKFSPAIRLPNMLDKPDPVAQADAERRDRAFERETKRVQILRRPWRQTTFLEPRPTTPVVLGEDRDVVNIAALQHKLDTDPRQKRWKSCPIPTQPITLEIGPEKPAISLSAVGRSYQWKTNKGEPIPFPEDEDPDHVELVRSKLPSRLAHLEGFFSKAASTNLPPHRPGHDVILELDKPKTGSPPTYRTPVEFLPLEKETVDELLRIGFIEPCMQADPAPVLFVPKPHSKERRFCTDYRWINQFLKDRFVPAPDVNGTIFNCRNAKRFTKIDIIRAFNRLRMAVGSDAYADDVLVYSDGNEEEHWDQVEEVIYRLSRVDLQGDIKKSRFNVTTVDYLGIVMDAGLGIRIDPDKLQAISDWKFEDLTSKTAVRSFLGLCNYIRMFCHHASSVAEPLNRLLKKDAKFAMGPEQRRAFEEMKRLACDAPVMAFFTPGRPTKVETDASRNATGGAIWQQQPGWRMEACGILISKTMTPAERAYPIQDRELLAVVQTLKHYEPELLGTSFFVVTDHQALVYYSTKRLLSTRQVRWADFLANFNITFQYRRGKDNIAADALSRKTADLPTVKAREKEERTMILIPPEKITPTVAAVSTADPNAHVVSGADLVDLIRQENEKQKLGQHQGKLVVPETTLDGQIFLRTALIREAHEPKIFAHAGQNKTIQMIKRRYFWEGMSQTIRKYIKNCHDCERNKGRHDKTPGLLHPLPIPNYVWEHVAVDGKDMPKDKFGYDYVALHPQTQGAVEITNQELDQKLRFYIDKYQTSWSVHLPALDFAHNAAWHSSLGMCPLKVVLGTEPRNPLSTDLPTTTVDSDQKRKALQIVRQTKEVQELARQNALKTQARQEEQANKKRRPVDFGVNDYVFVKKKGFPTTAPTTRLDSQWTGPWQILEERGYSYVLDVPESFKGKNLFHADRLRKAAMDPLPQQKREPPPPEEINGEPEFVVDKVLASRLFSRSKILQYQVAWQGCDPDDTWYPAENFKNSATALDDFHKKYKDAAGPPKRLAIWIKAAAEDKLDEPNQEDNVAEHGELNGKRKKRRHG
uniref:Retrotransposable element Tf2 protein-like protein n=2 Tax=Pyricularia TaxID=48558 RepID=Q5EMU5_PYRGI|nr:retrotransposable element Tf2 protein-like protein [Pyricularia grisea]